VQVNYTKKSPNHLFVVHSLCQTQNITISHALEIALERKGDLAVPHLWLYSLPVNSTCQIKIEWKNLKTSSKTSFHHIINGGMNKLVGIINIPNGKWPNKQRLYAHLHHGSVQ
jgi:hypothetical protein